MKNIILLISFFTILSSSLIKAQWIAANGPSAGSVYAFAGDEQHTFAGVYHHGVYLSTDDGMTWTDRNNGLNSEYIYSLALNGSDLFAGGYWGVYYSSDYGSNWTQRGLDSFYVRCLIVLEGRVYAGTGNGVYKSTDNGLSWENANSGIEGLPVKSIAVKDNFIFAGTRGIRSLQIR